MHISALYLKNFRCFQEQTLFFQPGLNVLIGENNAGKTSVLAALRHVLDRKAPGFSGADVHCTAQHVDTPPEIVLMLTIQVAEDDTSEDKAAVSTWVTRCEAGQPWEAQLSIVFKLRDDYHAEYQRLYRLVPDADANARFYFAFGALFDAERFTTHYYGGLLSDGNGAQEEHRRHFECQFLDAQRNAEEQLSSGKSGLLRRVLRRLFNQSEAVAEKQVAFYEHRTAIVHNLKERLDQTALFSLAKDIWGDAYGRQTTPDFWGQFNELEMLQMLLLKLQNGHPASFVAPLSHNGLGYNNLLFVAMVLAYLGIAGADADDEAPAFPVLLMEEPEAHLHPALQYRFLLFLRERLEPSGAERQPNRQVFLTSHATQITSAVPLDNLLCLYVDEHHTPHVAYPGRAFAPEEHLSKSYVERFLDATKSALLFSKSVLLVEGIAEQLLVPHLADVAYPRPGSRHAAWLDRNFVALVRTDGITFKHFLPLFGFSSDPAHRPYGLHSRRVACVSDGDPVWRVDSLEGKQGTRCFPFQDQVHSASARKLRELREALPAEAQQRLFIGLADKTFEYDLAFHNHTLQGLVTSAFSASKQAALKLWMTEETISRDPSEWYPTAGKWSQGWKTATEAFASYAATETSEDTLRRNRLAAHYLAGCEDSKGEHAFQLAAFFAQNKDSALALSLPPYLDDAIRHVCHQEPLPVRAEPTTPTAATAAGPNHE